MEQLTSFFSEFVPNLERWLRGVINDEVQLALIAEQQRKKPQKTYSRDEVAKMAHISMPTLWKRVKDGKITPLPNSGRRVIFAEEEVKKFLGEA